MTRLHHSLVKGLAQDLREAGLNADVEITMADLHTVKPEGGIVEARMDLMVTRAGGVHSWPIDLRTIDSYSAHGFASLEKAMADACKRKRRRYRGRVWPMVIDTRGGLFHETCELLETPCFGSSYDVQSFPFTAGATLEEEDRVDCSLRVGRNSASFKRPTARRR